MRILYHAINGSGLGHLMRLSAIALAVRDRAPDTHQLVATSANHPAHLRRLGMPSIVLPSDDAGPLLEADRRARTISKDLAARILGDVVWEYDPGVVVFDTHAHRVLVDEVTREGRRAVLVFRHCREDYILKAAREERFARFDAVLVPHTEEEMRAMLGARTMDRFVRSGPVQFVGGVAFPAAPTGAEIARAAAKHGVAPDDELLLVTAGSGGYGAITGGLVERLCRAAAGLSRRDRALRVLCVAGPNADAAALPEGAALVASEPNLQPLMARADLVVAHGGYNTVQEILQTGAPAALFPVYRKSEDQDALLRVLEARGRVRRIDPSAPLPQIQEIYADVLARPRPRPERLPGAARAAEVILALAGGPSAYVCGPRSALVPGGGARVEPAQVARALRRRRDQRAVVRADWDLVDALLDALGPRAAARVEALEVHLGEADPAGWEDQARCVLRVLHDRGFDPAAATLCVRDGSGGEGLAALTERIRDASFRALVAQVPGDPFHTRPDRVFESAERCRRVNPAFDVDITIAEDPVLSIDQP
jgi:predicted glycosyltransferase